MRHGQDESILEGAQVLVVEDDFLISLELEAVLAAAGAEVVGPSRTLADALARVDRDQISVAILDVRLGGDTVGPVAHGLSARNIPFFFYTGQDTNDPICREWPATRVICKPALPQALVAAVAALVEKPT